MKILFLHFSDFHFSKVSDVNEFHVKKIIDTFSVLRNVERIIMILSGDITYSGESEQFRAASKFISIFFGILKRSGVSSHVEILCVPGNHDVFHNGDCLTSEHLQSIRKANLYENHLGNEIDKLQNFYIFADRNNCYKDDKLISQKTIKIKGFEIEANLINSAIFSSIEEDKGLHFLTNSAINNLNVPTGADFVITIMHHSHDWYNDKQKIMLDSAIFGKSSIVFLGHEHHIATKTISYERDQAALVQAGGCLCEKDDWSSSSFLHGLLDTLTLEYNLQKFQWNTNEKQYESIENHINVLAKKPSIEKRIPIQKGFIESLCRDSKHEISNDFRDYFVFPRVQSDNQNGTPEKEFVDEESFKSEILTQKKVLLTGGYNSGKTTLLKKLFILLSNDYYVLYFDIADISRIRVERIIKSCFEDIYGDNPSDFERFKQISAKEKILLIDNIDQLKPSDFTLLIESIEELFNCFIFTSKQTLDLNLIDRMKARLKVTDLTFRYKILPFYTDKRFDLIKRLVQLQSNDESYILRTSRLLSEAIKAQKRFISLDPDFIINYVVYYCKNIGEATSNESGVFSKVFEAGLIGAISKFQKQKLSVDKIFVLLSKIAHHIHFQKSYPVSRIDTIEIIEKYNHEYGDNVNCIEAINIMTNSKVLLSTDDDSGYKFANKSYLAFFVAREVNNQYNTTGIDSDLQKILSHSCFGINSDILLFISYITDNIRILRLIINMAEEYTKDWGEFNFTDNMPGFLKAHKCHLIDKPSSDDKSKHEAEEIEAEKLHDRELKAYEIYDYSEDQIDNFVNQIIRACSLLIIIAKCLPNFEHNMPKSDKDLFINAIYKLPNRIFNLWSNEVNKELNEIIQFFKEQSQDYFSRQRSITDDDIIHALQWGAMSMLLDLYNIAVSYSVKENTSEYLERFNYKSNCSYSLEYLMALEKQNATGRFTDFAIELHEKYDDNIFRELCM